jgi:hypothetical protein
MMNRTGMFKTSTEKALESDADRASRDRAVDEAMDLLRGVVAIRLKNSTSRMHSLRVAWGTEARDELDRTCPPT